MVIAPEPSEVSLRDVTLERAYREEIALYHRPMAILWPHGRVRAQVQAWREGVPHGGLRWRGRRSVGETWRPIRRAEG
jgi:hypothetical protein